MKKNKGCKKINDLITNLSYSKKILMLFLIVSVIPVLTIGIFTYYMSKTIMTNQLEYSVGQSIDQMVMSISTKQNQLIKASYLIICSKEVQEFSINGQENTSFQMLRNYLNNLEELFDLYRIRIFLYPGNSIKDGFNVFSVDDFKYMTGIKENECTEIIWNSTYKFKKSSDEVFVFSIIRPIKSIMNSKTVLGFCSLDVSEKDLYKIITATNLKYNGRIYIIDKNNNIVSSSNKELLGTKFKGYKSISGISNGSLLSGGFMTVIRPVDTSGWRIVMQIPLEEIDSESKIISNATIIIALATFIVLLISSIIFSRSLSAKITSLTSSMENYRKTKYHQFHQEPAADVKTGDELDKLRITYEQMIRRIEYLDEEVVRYKIVGTQLKLNALQSQINPHFLYNTLYSIIFLLKGNKQYKASQMIMALANFFKYMVSKGEDKITIDDELNMAASYLEIQSTIHHDKFDWSIDVDNNIKSFLITKFTLQPIIENSIVHGIKNSERKCELKITGCFEEDDIVFKVTDNGVGMSEDILTKLQRSICDQLEMNKTGYGLRNVDQRLKLLWGDKYGLTITSKLNEGTTVLVIIPQDV